MKSEPTSREPNARWRPTRVGLAALAGGGLTVLGLGPGANAALAGEPTTSTVTTQEETQPPTTTTTPTTTTQEEAQPPATTTTEVPVPKEPPAKPPKVVLQKPQRPKPRTSSSPHNSSPTSGRSKKKSSEPNNVAGAPNSIAELSALEALLSSGQTSAEALRFYRIPLFLLPIYKAAAVQYGVPWQILAAINEIETDYGADLSVSSAGALGWMQFMPGTWLQYGVDAVEAGYADPFNPVDAIFAAARYLRAAGAETNLREAVFAYNHSEEYVDSVLLRAKLIATYPRSVLETLTGLVDGTMPVTGTRVSWTVPQATAAAARSLAPAPSTVLTQASRAATSAALRRAQREAAAPPIYARVTSTAHAAAVAVQAGRIVRMGHTAAGYYIVLRDIYGDQYTYAGLGRLARTYSDVPSKSHGTPLVVQAASTTGPAPSHAATAGSQQPQTLKVQPHAERGKPPASLAGAAYVPEANESVPAGMGRVRLYAHPGNPDQRAAVAAAKARAAAAAAATTRLTVGSVVAKDTVLGEVQDSTQAGGESGAFSFSVQPTGDAATVDPAPLLANWAQLQRALHPKGARATDPLLGATSSEVFLLSPAQLRRTVLSDSGIAAGQCERHAIASGAVDSRVLAVLAFLSRSGLQPTIGEGGCAASARNVTVDITAINGTKIADHQGAGTITDLTIRTLLTLPASDAPTQITSLMRYPGQTRTKADAAFWNRIQVTFAAPAAAAAHAAAHSRQKLPSVSTTMLTPAEWTHLFGTIGSIPEPTVATRATRYAISDHPLH